MTFEKNEMSRNRLKKNCFLSALGLALSLGLAASDAQAVSVDVAPNVGYKILGSATENVANVSDTYSGYTLGGEFNIYLNELFFLKGLFLYAPGLAISLNSGSSVAIAPPVGSSTSAVFGASIGVKIPTTMLSAWVGYDFFNSINMELSSTTAANVPLVTYAHLGTSIHIGAAYKLMNQLSVNAVYRFISFGNYSTQLGGSVLNGSGCFKKGSNLDLYLSFPFALIS